MKYTCTMQEQETEYISFTSVTRGICAQKVMRQLCLAQMFCQLSATFLTEHSATLFTEEGAESCHNNDIQPNVIACIIWFLLFVLTKDSEAYRCESTRTRRSTLHTNKLLQSSTLHLSTNHLSVPGGVYRRGCLGHSEMSKCKGKLCKQIQHH